MTRPLLIALREVRQGWWHVHPSGPTWQNHRDATTLQRSEMEIYTQLSMFRCCFNFLGLGTHDRRMQLSQMSSFLFRKERWMDDTLHILLFLSAFLLRLGKEQDGVSRLHSSLLVQSRTTKERHVGLLHTGDSDSNSARNQMPFSSFLLLYAVKMTTHVAQGTPSCALLFSHTICMIYLFLIPSIAMRDTEMGLLFIGHSYTIRVVSTAGMFVLASCLCAYGTLSSMPEQNCCLCGT